MAEARRSMALLCLALALGLLWLPMLLPSRFVLAAVWLAQPLLALGWSLRAGSVDARTQQALSLAVVWAVGYVGLALVLFWPLPALLRAGSLQASLQVSGVLGLGLIALWSVWPRFAVAALADVAIDGDAEPLPGREHGAFFDLLPALLVLSLLAAGLALAWPGLLPIAWWLPAVLGHAALALIGHALLRHGLLERWAGHSARPSRVLVAAARSNGEQQHIDDLLVGWPQARSEPRFGSAEADGSALAERELSDSVLADSSVSQRSSESDAERRLYQCARSGQVEAALQGLADGADPHTLPQPTDRDQRTLPMLAALLGDLRLLRELIVRGVDLNASYGGLTPLLAATRDSWHGRPEAVTMLLANGGDARSVDSQGNTPLHHAARSTDPAVAALLLDAGAEVNALNAEGVNPLGIACAAGNWRLAKYLLEHGAKAEPIAGQPALLAAAGGEDEAIGVQLLLRYKARVDSRGHHDRTALLNACQAGNVDIVGALLDAGADANALDQQGISPLLEAARHGHAEVIARLAQAKPDPHACDERGRNALCLACEAGGSPALISQLQALGVNAEQRDAEGRCARDIAVAGGRWRLVAVLDPEYPLPASIAHADDSAADKTPKALLREALSEHRYEAAESLQRLGAWPDADSLAGLLLEFSNDSDERRLAWLLRHGAHTDARSASGDSVLFQLLDRGDAARVAVRAALAAGVGVGGRGGLARFLTGCLAGSQSPVSDPSVAEAEQNLALDLLGRGADPFGGAEASPVHLSVRLGWNRLTQGLLELGVDPNRRDSRGRTALHLATGLGDLALVQCLIRLGARSELSASDGQTPLGIALAAGRRDLADWLEWRYWSLPGRPLQNADLPAAAALGDADAVARLLALGLPVDAIDAQGCTALLRASGGGHVETVARLLAASATVDLAAQTGATPLSAAISRRHPGLVDCLLAAGANANQPLPGAISPLMLAAALGLPDMVEQLLRGGASASAIDEQGMGVLHCATSFAFSCRERNRALALLNSVLAKHPAIDQPTLAGHTPLLLALGARADAGVTCDEEVILAVLERLLEARASVSAQDQRGWSSLHLAAVHGLSRVVQRLLREGADRTLRDSLGRTPHDLAVLRGYVDVAAEFAAPRGSPSMARFLREPSGDNSPSP